MNEAGFGLMQWTVHDPAGFQYYPYTMGWGVIPCSMISNRVIMQPVMDKDLKGFFWRNELMFE
jgi:hypothetical protein